MMRHPPVKFLSGGGEIPRCQTPTGPHGLYYQYRQCGNIATEDEMTHCLGCCDASREQDIQPVLLSRADRERVREVLLPRRGIARTGDDVLAARLNRGR